MLQCYPTLPYPIHARGAAGAPIKTLVKVVSIMAFSGACAGLLVSVLCSSTPH